MSGILSIGFFLLILVVIGELILKEKIIVLKHEKMPQKARRVENVVVSILIISYLMFVFKFVVGESNTNILFIVLPLLIIVSTFRAIMEWVFNRNANKWALEIYSSVSITVVILVLVILQNKFIG